MSKIFTIIIMRLIQLAFGCIKPVGKSKIIYASSAMAVGIIYGLCNIIAYIAMKDDFRPRRQVMDVLLIEFVVWETFLMPLALAISCMINPRTANYMKALKRDNKKPK